MTKNQRVVVLALLLCILLLLWHYPLTSPGLPTARSIVVLTALFMLSFTVLLLEHFFTKPTDVISAAVSILFLLIPSHGMLMSWGRWYDALLYYEIGVASIATVALLLLKEGAANTSRNKASLMLRTIAVRIGDGRTQYFALASLAIVFVVEPRSAAFIALFAYALLVLAIQPQHAITWLTKAATAANGEIGEVMAVEGGTSYLVRLHQNANNGAPAVGSLVEVHYNTGRGDGRRKAVVVEQFLLDHARWLRAVCHPSIDAACAGQAARAYQQGTVYALPTEDTSRFFANLVGFVASGAEIGTLRFTRVGGARVEEGDLVEVVTSDGPVIYQVVNGRVDSETLDRRNRADLVLGEAIQLGRWNEHTGTFSHHGWVPDARTPVTRLSDLRVPLRTTEDVALGVIPSTCVPVLLDAREAISHHTAILGVTGVGKSMFARNLVRQLAREDARVVVIDFTREWKNQLTGNALPTMIDEATASTLRKAIKTIAIEEAKYKSQQNDNTTDEAKRELNRAFKAAVKRLVDEEDRVRVFELPDVSNTEGVLQYTQWFFKTLFNCAREDQLGGKRVCVVLEEAHTVVPEWNFVGLADKSSQALVNSIGQIALQGRKYNVGFVVIAQRTANVSKTVLTQCNTIMAFQCYDNTSLEFLGNYLPHQLVRALPTLGFRRAIAVGKAMRSSVPLIFEVPDLKIVEESVRAPSVSTLSVEAQVLERGETIL